MALSVAFHSLGCKVNSYESEVMERSFIAHGFTVVPWQEKADVYVVNTCSVTNIADRKSRQMLHQARRKNPCALVVAVGCYVETDTDAVRADTEIDLAVGNVDKARVVEHVEGWLVEKSGNDPAHIAPSTPLSPGQATFRTNADSRGLGLNSVAQKSQGSLPDFSLSMPANTHHEQPELTGSSSSRTRAFIKVQDGCNLFCSYCIIPYARGRNRSRDEEEILAEVRAVAAAGVKEVVLTGIHISSYGKETDGGKYDRGTGTLSYFSSDGIGHSLPDEKYDSVPVPLSYFPLLNLLSRLHEIDGIERIRLSSLEPRIVTEEFAEGLAALPKVCPHFHLSLQSGDNATLMRMRRHYTVGEYKKSVERLRRVYDNPAITTDIICGFPGETEEQFARTLAFAEEIGFYEIHVFPYSKRKGTAAASFAGQLTNAVKKERASRLLALTAEQSRTYRAQFLNKKLRVLWEDTERSNGGIFMIGNTERYVRVAMNVSDLSEEEIDALSGTFSEVTPTAFLDDETLV